MSGSDNLAAGFSGAASAATDLLGKYIEYQFKKKAKHEDLLNELELYKAKLPIQQATTLATKQRESDIEMRRSLALLPAQEASKIRVAQATPGMIYDQESGTFTPAPAPGRVTTKPVDPFTRKKMIDEAALQDKLEKEFPKASGSYQKTVKDYKNLIDQAKAIRDDPDLEFSTGFVAGRQNVSAGARRIAANLETVKSRTLINVLSSLKELSSTGASGFGQLSNVEGETLKNSIANLSRTLATPDFKKNINFFIRDAEDSLKIVSNTFKNTYEPIISRDPSKIAGLEFQDGGGRKPLSSFDTEEQ